MKKTIQATLFLVVVFLLLPSKILAQWNQPQWVVDMYEPYVYNFVYNGTDEALAYRLLRPVNFGASKQYPVVITLHGASGFNKTTAKDYNINNLRGINGQFAKDSIRVAHPAYIICLQAIKFADGSNDMWNRKHLAGVKQIIAALPNVDANQIYVMGQSAGAHGTNNFISYDPNYFAAAIATSAEGNKISVANRDKLVNFNLWTMHGDGDNVIPYTSDVELFDYMKGINASMKFTTFIGRGHSTEDFLVGSYAASGKTSIAETDPTTGITTVRVYDYKTEYAGPGSDPEPNTLDWLFSKKLGGNLNVGPFSKDKSELSVYPNPTHSVANWSCSSSFDEVVVINSNGKMAIKIVNPTTNSIDLSSLKSGLYFLKMRQNNSVITKKIVKK